VAEIDMASQKKLDRTADGAGSSVQSHRHKILSTQNIIFNVDYQTHVLYSTERWQLMGVLSHPVTGRPIG
jgi:hypothetical protein